MTTPLHLHPARLFPADPGTSAIARRLYEGVAGLPDNYTLTASVASLGLTAVIPDHHGTGADAVLTLAGAGLPSRMTPFPGWFTPGVT